MGYDKAEIWLDGYPLGEGLLDLDREVVERNTYNGTAMTETRLRANIRLESEDSHSLPGAWVVKHYIKDQLIEKEFDTREEAEMLFDYIEEMEFPGRYVLVHRPETEDVVVRVVSATEGER